MPPIKLNLWISFLTYQINLHISGRCAHPQWFIYALILLDQGFSSPSNPSFFPWAPFPGPKHLAAVARQRWAWLVSSQWMSWKNCAILLHISTGSLICRAWMAGPPPPRTHTHTQFPPPSTCCRLKHFMLAVWLVWCGGVCKQAEGGRGAEGREGNCVSVLDEYEKKAITPREVSHPSDRPKTSAGGCFSDESAGPADKFDLSWDDDLTWVYWTGAGEKMVSRSV